MKRRSTVAMLAALGVLAGACGAGAPPATGAGSGGAACGVPVKAKCPAEAQAITGTGATFPAPIYTKWIDEYNKVTGVQINYQAVGSGGGIKAFTDGTADFGASDVPLTDKQIDAITRGFYMLPTVLGAVVPTYDLPGNPKLKFTGAALSDIYLGKITKWSDPAIAAENPGVTLPDTSITVVHRSDGSGTTGVFTDYLNKVSPEWKQKVGSATSVNWPVGLGASGNAGVAGAVKQTPGAIGYVELIYALQNKLGFGVVKNGAGTYVEASLASTTAASDGVTLPDLGDLKGKQDQISITNSKNPASWPISTFTFWLVPKDFADRGKALATLRFMWYGVTDGQKFAQDLGYAPLPTSVQQKNEEILRSITVGGRPVLTVGG